MLTAIDLILLLLGALVLNRAFYWTRMAQLGIGSATPRMFLHHPNMYAWAALITAIACALLTGVPWYVDTAVGFAAMLIGVLQANARYISLRRSMTNDCEA